MREKALSSIRGNGSEIEDEHVEDFEKRHTETFMYFLKEYEKWQKLKQKSGNLQETEA